MGSSAISCAGHGFFCMAFLSVTLLLLLTKQPEDGFSFMGQRLQSNIPSQPPPPKKKHAMQAEDPVLDPHNLPDADAFFFGFPTRFGAMPAQFKVGGG